MVLFCLPPYIKNFIYKRANLPKKELTAMRETIVKRKKDFGNKIDQQTNSLGENVSVSTRNVQTIVTFAPPSYSTAWNIPHEGGRHAARRLEATGSLKITNFSFSSNTAIFFSPEKAQSSVY